MFSAIDFLNSVLKKNQIKTPFRQDIEKGSTVHKCLGSCSIKCKNVNTGACLVSHTQCVCARKRKKNKKINSIKKITVTRNIHQCFRFPFICFSFLFVAL